MKQKQRLQFIFNAILVSILLTPLSQSLADVTCASIFLEAQTTEATSAKIDADKFQQVVKKFRIDNIKPIDFILPETLVGYRVVGKLGQSNWIALLVENSQRKKFVFKVPGLFSKARLQRLWREVALTQFYSESGETVPKIYGVHGQSILSLGILKEYNEGITGTEVSRNIALLKNQLIDDKILIDNMLDRQRELKKIFRNGNSKVPSFQNWYQANLNRLAAAHPNLWKIVQEENNLNSYELDRMLSLSDANRGNLLFDIRLNKWILFDP